MLLDPLLLFTIIYKNFGNGKLNRKRDGKLQNIVEKGGRG